MDPKKWPEAAPDRELTLITLTKGCASGLIHLVASLSLILSDWFLCVYLKIAGSSIQKDLKDRRGLSLLHVIGLRYSVQKIAFMLGRDFKAPSQLITRSSEDYQPELPLEAPTKFLSVSVENSVSR